jgi:hypothetical protein
VPVEPTTPSLPVEGACGVCGTATGNRCARCGNAFFCCRAHQRGGWAAHLPRCTSLPDGPLQLKSPPPPPLLSPTIAPTTEGEEEDEKEEEDYKEGDEEDEEEYKEGEEDEDYTRRRGEGKEVEEVEGEEAAPAHRTMIPFYALGSFVVVTGETYPGKRGYLSDSVTAIRFDSFSGLYTVWPTVGQARDRGGVEECSPA